MGVDRRRRNVPDAKPPMGGGIGDGIKIATDASGGELFLRKPPGVIPGN